VKHNDVIGAELSDCGRYRYRLWRRWGSGSQVLWIMLNPSTADAERDDPTIRRCAGFTRAWGCDGFSVVNLFALRATDPRELRVAEDPIGPNNDELLRHVIRQPWYCIVAAWGGANGLPRRMLDERERLVCAMSSHKFHCFGTTKREAHPLHPLYISGVAKLVPW
jgi:hypothetical protein